MSKPRKREKASSGRAKRDDPLKEATVLIPLTYNDETEVPKGTIEAIFEELFVAFHGWTIEGTVKGAYRMRTGQKRVEDLLKVADFVVKFIPPRTEEG